MDGSLYTYVLVFVVIIVMFYQYYTNGSGLSKFDGKIAKTVGEVICRSKPKLQDSIRIYKVISSQGPLVGLEVRLKRPFSSTDTIPVNLSHSDAQKLAELLKSAVK